MVLLYLLQYKNLSYILLESSKVNGSDVVFINGYVSIYYLNSVVGYIG